MIYPPINAQFAQYYQPFVNKMKIRESGGKNVDSKGRIIKAKTSSAAGIYQVTNGTWKLIEKQLNRRCDRYNLDDNESIMHQLFNNYCSELTRYGVKINNTTLYGVHFAGNAKWMKTAFGNPNLSVNYGFGSAALKANPFLVRLGTLGAVFNNFAKSMNGPNISQMSNAQFYGKSVDYQNNSPSNTDSPALPPPVDKAVTSKKDQTVAEFIESNNILMTENELISYLDNGNSIFKSYNQKQKIEYKKASKELIVSGTKVMIPMYQLAAPKSIYTVNQTIIENLKYTAFVEKEVRKLLDNPDYKKINNFASSDEQSLNFGSLFKRMNNISVWVWSKATDFSNGSHLIDITPFIIDLNTNVGENGGNFSMTLPTITYESLKSKETAESKDFDIPVTWMQSELFESFVSKNSTHELTDFDSNDIKCDYKDDNDEIKVNNKILKRKPSFFNTILQKNDVVFIRFERLAVDRVYSGYESGEFRKIPAADLAGNVYDMIGLIDTVALATNGENSDQIVSIQGRDLSKLLIDDSIYNFIVGYGVQDREQIIKNSNQTKSTGRIAIDVDEARYNVGDGIAQDLEFNFFQTHSIDEWITFILSQLTNITIAPDNLFNGYKNRSMITSRQNSVNSNGDFNYKETLASGIWQIVKLCFDAPTLKRRLADDSLSTNTGSLINIIRKYAQKPFVDFNMDTYGDRFYFMFRKPPFTYDSFKTNPCINIFDSDITKESLEFDTEYYTMFQLDALGSMIDATDGANLITIPAVMMPEMAKIFGLRNLNIGSNYLDFDMSVSNLTTSNLDHLREQQANDLNWIIESHIYLPFTRKGSITIKGDRRIKRGMNIRNTGTGEVFYVDSVSNFASFGSDQSERLTTIQVSRGVVEKHLEVYFNLVKIDKLNDNYTYKEDIKNIQFLLSRKQFR